MSPMPQSSVISERSSSSNSSRLMSWAGLETHKKTVDIELWHRKSSAVSGGTLQNTALVIILKGGFSNLATAAHSEVTHASLTNAVKHTKSYAASSPPGLYFLCAPLDSAGGCLNSSSVCDVWRKCCNAAKEAIPHITYGRSRCIAVSFRPLQRTTSHRHQ